MTKSPVIRKMAANNKSVRKTKSQLVIDLLSRDEGSTLGEMSTLASWQPHSTRSFMTGLKKKGHVVESDKVDGIRRYRIVSSGGA